MRLCSCNPHYSFWFVSLTCSFRVGCRQVTRMSFIYIYVYILTCNLQLQGSPPSLVLSFSTHHLPGLSLSSLSLISMTPVYHSSFSPFLIDLNEDQQHNQFFCSKSTEEASSSSSLSYPVLINPSQEDAGFYHGEFHQPLIRHQEQVA